MMTGGTPILGTPNKNKCKRALKTVGFSPTHVFFVTGRYPAEMLLWFPFMAIFGKMGVDIDVNLAFIDFVD